MAQLDDEPDEAQVFGPAAQPAIAALMAPHLRLTEVGAGCALIGVAAAVAALVAFPRLSQDQAGGLWAVAALLVGCAMFAICAIQVVVWRRALASWAGSQVRDLHGLARLSWLAHVASYGIALLGLITCMTASSYAGWSAASAAFLTVSVLAMLAAQVLAGVQFLRPYGPPGTLPAHIRRLVQRNQHKEDHLGEDHLGEYHLGEDDLT